MQYSGFRPSDAESLSSKGHWWDIFKNEDETKVPKKLCSSMSGHLRSAPKIKYVQIKMHFKLNWLLHRLQTNANSMPCCKLNNKHGCLFGRIAWDYSFLCSYFDF